MLKINGPGGSGKDKETAAMKETKASLDEAWEQINLLKK